MKPIKPRYSDTVKANWNISKKSKEIINQYSQYTKYDESEIIDILIQDILEDKDFIVWLKSRRYQTKINKLIFDVVKTQSLGDDGGETHKENC